MSYYALCICIPDWLFILIHVVFLVFSLNYCFAAVVLIATNKVEYINIDGDASPASPVALTPICKRPVVKSNLNYSSGLHVYFQLARFSVWHHLHQLTEHASLWSIYVHRLVFNYDAHLQRRRKNGASNAPRRLGNRKRLPTSHRPLYENICHQLDK